MVNKCSTLNMSHFSYSTSGILEHCCQLDIFLYSTSCVKTRVLDKTARQTVWLPRINIVLYFKIRIRDRKKSWIEAHIFSECLNVTSCSKVAKVPCPPKNSQIDSASHAKWGEGVEFNFESYTQSIKFIGVTSPPAEKSATLYNCLYFWCCTSVRVPWIEVWIGQIGEW